jgi:ATP-dependent exoDNAse (exonuclease V) beta subunit
VAGDPDSHIYAFQGSTDQPIRGFGQVVPTASHVELTVRHRSGGALWYEAWAGSHPSEEYAAAARELRRIHARQGVPWGDLAVIVRRDDQQVGGLLRALDDAGVPRTRPEGGLALLSEPATRPFVLAFRWLAHPGERDGTIESVLASDLARLSPAAARGLIRAARAAGEPAAAALHRTDGLTAEEADGLTALAAALDEAELVAARSAMDAFEVLWRRLPYARRLVGRAEISSQGRRDLEAVLALSQAVGRIRDRSDASVSATLEVLEAGADGPGLASAGASDDGEAVRVLTAHASAGLEFDSVIVVGAAEGNFPSLARPEPMFDLAALQGHLMQSERNQRRLEDERRLFDVVASRARRRVLFTASDPHGEESVLASRSRFVAPLGVRWSPLPDGAVAEPLSLAEAAAGWRRSLGDAGLDPAARLASLSGLLAMGEPPTRWWYQRDWTGTDRPLHETIRVSYSKLSTLENCALQYVLSEELGLEGQAGYYAWVGHLVHSIIEECENGEIERTEAALVQAVEDRWSPNEFPSHAVSEAFRRRVTRQMIPAWIAAYGETKALAGEIGFQFEFEGATVTGKIDRVSRAGRDGCQITDYKTGKSRSAPPSEENLQLGIYYLAVMQAPELARFGPVRQVELAFLREKTAEGMVKRVQLGMNSAAQRVFGEAMASRLSGLIGEIRELDRTETYRPSPQADCHYCDFKSLCPLWPEGRDALPLPAKATA